MSVQADSPNFDALQAFDDVRQTWPVRRIMLGKESSAAASDEMSYGNYSVHTFTGVERVHQAGIFGQGAVVAIVDTGTDYRHPAVRTCLASPCKLPLTDCSSLVAGLAQDSRWLADMTLSGTAVRSNLSAALC